MGVDSNLLREMLMTPQIFLLVGLTIAVFTDTYLSRTHKMLMQVIFILAMSLVVQNVVEDWLACEHPNIQMRTGFAMYGYIVRPLFLLLFCHIVYSRVINLTIRQQLNILFPKSSAYQSK